jgi:hypothetical protein
MKEVRPSETSLNIYQATRRHIIDESNHYRHRRENFKIPDQIHVTEIPDFVIKCHKQKKNSWFLSSLLPLDTFLSSSSLSLFIVTEIIVQKRRFDLCTRREPYKMSSRTCCRVAEEGCSSFGTSKTSTRLYGVRFHKTAIFTVTVLRTSKFQIRGLGSLKSLTRLRHQISQNNNSPFLQSLSVN